MLRLPSTFHILYRKKRATHLAVISCLLAACSNQSGIDAAWRRFIAVGKITFTTPSGLIAVVALLVAIIAIILAFRYRGVNSQVKSASLDTLLETATQFAYPERGDSNVSLLVLQGDETLLGKSFPLYPGHATSIGRSLREVELAFQVNQERSVVSRKHCEIRGEILSPSMVRFQIVDLGSTHGTYVNGERLLMDDQRKTLSAGDQIELGPVDQGGVLLQFKQTRSEAKTQIEPADSTPTYFGSP